MEQHLFKPSEDNIIEILRDIETMRTDGVHRVMTRGIFPDQYDELASRIAELDGGKCPKCKELEEALNKIADSDSIVPNFSKQA